MLAPERNGCTQDTMLILRLVKFTITMIPAEPKDKMHDGNKEKNAPFLIPLVLEFL